MQRPTQTYETSNSVTIEIYADGRVVWLDESGETEYQTRAEAIADITSLMETGAGEWWVEDCERAILLLGGKLTGHRAIDFAERNDYELAKHADPTEEAREGVTVEEAREIAAIDPSLIYLEVSR